MNQQKPEQSSYGWAIVVATFLITCITCGINFSFGVFLLPITGDLGWTRGTISVVFLIAGLVYAATIPICGLLADRYGYRWVLAVSTACLSLGLIFSSQIHSLWQLYLFNGALVGLSISASFAIPVALVALWFTRRQGLAVGTATLGISLGTALIPLLNTYLLSSVGWRLTYLIAGIAVAIICIPSALIMRKPPISRVSASAADNISGHSNLEDRATEAEDPGFTLSEAVRTREFWFLFVLFLLFLLTLGLVMLHIIPYAVDSGLSPLEAAAIFTLIGVFGLIGRFASGLLSDRIGIKPVILFCLILEAAIIVWITFCREMWVFYTFAAFFGIAYSGFVTMMVRITRYVFGSRALASVFGCLMISDGIGFGVGPFLAGYIFDFTGSYTISLLTVAVGLVAASVLTLIIKPAARDL